MALLALALYDSSRKVKEGLSNVYETRAEHWGAQRCYFSTEQLKHYLAVLLLTKQMSCGIFEHIARRLIPRPTIQIQPPTPSAIGTTEYKVDRNGRIPKQ